MAEADNAAQKITHLETLKAKLPAPRTLMRRPAPHKITQRTLDALEAPAAGNRVTFDAEIPGFGVRITANGVISFVLDYHIHGRQRRYTFGRYPEITVWQARDKALKLRAAVRDGHDPLQERAEERAEGLVSDLAKDYLDRHARIHKRPSSLRNDEGMLTRIILPKLGRLRVTAVGQRDIASLHGSLKETPYRANRVLSLLSKMFSLAVEWKWRPDNPCRGVQRFHEDRREGWLSIEQFQKLEQALDAYLSQDAADAIRLLMYTGSRAGEVLSAAWDELDLDRGIWTKPSHHTKQKRIEHVPLSARALAVLKRRAKRKNGPYVFPGRDGQHARVALRRPWVQALKAAGLVTRYEIKGKRRHVVVRYRPLFRLHDLRHTFASNLVSNGQSLHIVGKLLGHTEEKTTARYAHLAGGALREAVEQHDGIVNGGSTKTTKKRARAASA
ncbi:MAG TPA: site-specific integrase [Terriglobales bacterium]|nr:site-specific integrase [Terriglobales bacterium]